MSLATGKFRITLYALDTSTGWRGATAATIYDPIEVGVSERANEVGEAYWVLPNNHPLIGECTPLTKHYEVHRFDTDAGAYKWVGAGILDDAEVGEYETTFRGIDYMAVFNQYYTPTVALTFSSTSFLSPDIGQASISTDFLSTIFNFSGGTVLDGSDGETDPSGEAVGAVWFSNKAALVIDNVDVTSKVEDTLTINGSTVTTPSTTVIWDAVWNGTITAHFETTKTWRFRLDATPPAPESPQVPAVTGGVYEGTFLGDSSFAINNCSVTLYPYESKAAMRAIMISNGSTTAAADTALNDNRGKFALRKGVTYSFIIHGAIYRTSSGKLDSSGVGMDHWIRSLSPAKTNKFTLGTGYETFTQVFDRVFNASKTTFPLSRIRYATRTISGSPQTVMLTFSAGEPPVTYLANTARLEMTSRTDGSKTIFGISHPSSTGTYDGSFRVRYNVSSANIDTIRLSYPETVRSYAYSPGTSSVRTHVRVIPSTPYLAGTSSAGAVGINIDGATATTGESSTYGEIPLLETRAGLVDEIAAELEALRLADSSKTENTKTLDIVVKEEALKPWEGFDLGDAVSVHVVHGNVNLPSESLNIAGMDWVGFSDGHEELTLELINGTNF
jgi:hypothetical protein